MELNLIIYEHIENHMKNVLNEEIAKQMLLDKRSSNKQFLFSLLRFVSYEHFSNEDNPNYSKYNIYDFDNYFSWDEINFVFHRLKDIYESNEINELAKIVIPEWDRKKAKFHILTMLHDITKIWIEKGRKTLKKGDHAGQVYLYTKTRKIRDLYEAELIKDFVHDNEISDLEFVKFIKTRVKTIWNIKDGKIKPVAISMTFGALIQLEYVTLSKFKHRLKNIIKNAKKSKRKKIDRYIKDCNMPSLENILEYIETVIGNR